jgi:hypothetical protein
LLRDLVHQTQRGNLLKRSRAQLLNHALVLSLATGLGLLLAGRPRRLGAEFRIFSPRLDDERGLERPDHVAGPFAFRRCKTGNMVAVPVGGDDGVQFAVRAFLDVLGDVHHARLRNPLGKSGRSEIDQNMPFRFRAVGEADEKAIAEPDVICADCHALRGGGHGDLLLGDPFDAQAVKIGEL